MKIIPHTDEMIEEAQEWSNQLGAIKNSITKGRGNMAGKLGELAFSAYVGSPLEDKPNYDMIHNGEKLEIKTKQRAVAPKSHYDVSVAKTSRHQHPDRYVFISIEFDNKGYWGKPYTGGKIVGGATYDGVKNIWLCGDKGAEEYFKEATVLKKGDKDGSNNFMALVVTYNMKISDLEQSF